MRKFSHKIRLYVTLQSIFLISGSNGGGLSPLRVVQPLRCLGPVALYLLLFEFLS